MKAAIFESEGKVAIKNVPIPEIRKSDDVMLKVLASSICGTDLHILNVPPSFEAKQGVVLGHEYVGEVMDVGAGVTDLDVGQRVVINPNLSCGLCEYCRMGKPNICENLVSIGLDIDGGLAEYSVVPRSSLFNISSDLPLGTAVIAEPISCVMSAIRKVMPEPGESAVVLGAGPIGVLFTKFFLAQGLKEIYVSDPIEYRRAYAEGLGVAGVLDPNVDDVGKVVKDKTGIGADIVVDAAGTLINTSLDCVRWGGRVLLFGLSTTSFSSLQQFYISRYDITVFGTFIANSTFPATVNVIEDGVLDLQSMVSHEIKLEDIVEGVDLLRTGKAIKIVVYP